MILIALLLAAGSALVGLLLSTFLWKAAPPAPPAQIEGYLPRPSPVAEARATALLNFILTRDQQRTYLTRRYVDVPIARGYYPGIQSLRIFHNGAISFNGPRAFDGVHRGLCVHARSPYGRRWPQDDQVAALVLHARFNPDYFVRMANPI